MIEEIIKQLRDRGDIAQATRLEEQQGLPVIEDILEDSTKKKVTFYFYTADQSYEQVNIRSDFGYADSVIDRAEVPQLKPKDPYSGELPAIPMEKLDKEGHLWTCTVELPVELSTNYLFEPQVTKGVKVGWGGRVVDPLNKKGRLLDFSTKEEPDEVDQDRLRRYAINQEGKLRELKSKEDPLEEGERACTVHYPKGCKKGDEYPMRLFLDGGDYFEHGAASTLDDSPVINVMLEPQPDRDTEYRPDANIESFSEWLAQAIPKMREELGRKDGFRVKNNPADTAIVGTSLSGFAACYIGLRYPDVFGNVLTQSAALWFQDRESLEKLIELSKENDELCEKIDKLLEELAQLGPDELAKKADLEQEIQEIKQSPQFKQMEERLFLLEYLEELKKPGNEAQFEQLRNSCFYLEYGKLEDHPAPRMFGQKPLPEANRDFQEELDDIGVRCKITERTDGHMHAKPKYLPEACKHLDMMRQTQEEQSSLSRQKKARLEAEHLKVENKSTPNSKLSDTSGKQHNPSGHTSAHEMETFYNPTEKEEVLKWKTRPKPSPLSDQKDPLK